MFQFRWPRPGGRGWQWRRQRPGGRAPGASSPGQKSRRSKWLSWSFSVSGQQQNIAIITCCLFILKNPSNPDSCSIRTCFEFFLFQFLSSVGPHTSCSIFSRWDLSAFHISRRKWNPLKSWLIKVFGLIPPSETTNAVATFIQSMAPLNSAANPIIYCLFSADVGKLLR